MAAPIDRLRRIRAAALAGRALAPEDGAQLVAAIDGAMANGATLEEGLGLAPGWRGVMLRERIDTALRLLAGPGSARARARDLFRRLRRYAASGFPIDRRRGLPPEGERGELYRLLVANNGEVPSDEVLRKWLA